MKGLRRWLPAVALLLLSMAGVHMEHLQAVNLNIISPEDRDLVLNRGMRGIYSSHFQFESFFWLSISRMY